MTIYCKAAFVDSWRSLTHRQNGQWSVTRLVNIVICTHAVEKPGTSCSNFVSGPLSSSSFVSCSLRSCAFFRKFCLFKLRTARSFCREASAEDSPSLSPLIASRDSWFFSNFLSNSAKALLSCFLISALRLFASRSSSFSQPSRIWDTLSSQLKIGIVQIREWLRDPTPTPTNHLAPYSHFSLKMSFSSGSVDVRRSFWVFVSDRNGVDLTRRASTTVQPNWHSIGEPFFWRASNSVRSWSNAPLIFCKAVARSSFSQVFCPSFVWKCVIPELSLVAKRIMSGWALK